ncbi:MAG TPA: lysozyme inhibitor LprI family protein [Flavipsychrobacter sp.]|nr:lysozyme inhibitor LprI family protein [Flavipsychrobacter sp.]
MEAQNQSCLDKGIDIIGCQIRYYQQLDSVLNLTYRNLRSKLSEKEKASLKTKQLKWLRERDAYFKKLENDRDKNDIEISNLAMYLSMNNYIEDRITHLLKWQQKN